MCNKKILQTYSILRYSHFIDYNYHDTDTEIQCKIWKTLT